MLSRQRLFWFSRPYDLPGSDARFSGRCGTTCGYTSSTAAEYRLLCEAEDFSPDADTSRTGELRPAHPVFSAAQCLPRMPPGGWPLR